MTVTHLTINQAISVWPRSVSGPSNRHQQARGSTPLSPAKIAQFVSSDALNSWPFGGMVDTVGLKPAAFKGVPVRVRKGLLVTPNLLSKQALWVRIPRHPSIWIASPMVGQRPDTSSTSLATQVLPKFFESPWEALLRFNPS